MSAFELFTTLHSMHLLVYLISASFSVCRDRHRHSNLDVAAQVEDHKRMSRIF